MNNIVNSVSYLKTSRNFPEDLEPLVVEVNKAYIDIANVVNTRTIGIFPVNRPAITGESWYIVNNMRQQTFRQVYTFTTTADIPIGFKISSISGFSRTFGEYKSITGAVTSWFGLIPGTSVAIAGQISFYVIQDVTSSTSDLIRFAVGAGAPAMTSGTIVLEWLSFV